MKHVEKFEAFLRDEVNLNQTRLDRLQRSVNAVGTYLGEHETFGEIVLDVVPAGSWAHRSIIRPVTESRGFDADVLLLTKEQQGWQPKDYIVELARVLRLSGVYKDKTQKKTRCVRIDYADDFHLDVVPYLERSGAHYITNRCEPDEQSGRFELSDPEAFTAWVDERERYTADTFIEVVRLVKYLRDFKGTFICKSIILKTLLGQHVDGIEAAASPEIFADVPSTLRTLMNKLARSLPTTMPAVMDPAGTDENFTDRYGATWKYKNFRAKIRDYADRIDRAYLQSDRDASIKAWRAIFGDDFGTLSVGKSVTESALAASPSASTRASVPYADEDFIERAPYNFPVQLNPKFRARISGRVTGYRSGSTRLRNGFRTFDLAKSGNRVPKNRNIAFSVNTNVPSPHDVYWKVRNGGAEAADANCLRGEITEAAKSANHEKTEPTAYAGYHYVEVYIVQNGAVVAKDRHGVIVTN